jgi:hypothetical protein
MDQLAADEASPTEKVTIPAMYTGRSRDLELPWTALAVVVLPVLAYYLGDVFIETFGNWTIDVGFSADAKLADVEASNRYFFFAAYLMLVVTAVGLVAFYWSDVRCALNGRSLARNRLIMLLLVLLLGTSVIDRAGGSQNIRLRRAQGFCDRTVLGTHIRRKPSFLLDAPTWPYLVDRSKDNGAGALH